MIFFLRRFVGFCRVFPCRNRMCMLDRSNVHALLRYLSYCDCSMESKYHRSVETDLVGTSSTMVHRLRIVYDGTSSTMVHRLRWYIVYLAYGHCSVGGKYYRSVHAADL